MELAVWRAIETLDHGPMGQERTYTLKALLKELKKMNTETHLE
jgi:hypothetical protein